MPPQTSKSAPVTKMAYFRRNAPSDKEQSLDGENDWKGKVSYVVSGVLKGHEDRQLGYADGIFAVVDVVVHLALWVAAFILELVVRNQEHHGPRVYIELATASVCTLSTALGGVLVSVFIALMGLKPGSLYPFVCSAITMGGLASAIFSILYYLVAMSDDTTKSHFHDESTTYFTAEHVDDSFVTIRQLTLWLVAIKLLAVGMAQANMKYRVM